MKFAALSPAARRHAFMVDVLLLLPFCVIGWTILYWWPQIRSAALGAVRPRRHVLTDGVSGLAQLTTPVNWHPDVDLAAEPAIQASDRLQLRHFVVISHSREDFESSVDLAAFSTLMRRELAGSCRVLAVRGPVERQIGGFPALQFELDASYDRAILTYLHTAVAGERAFHLLLGWSTRSRFDRGTFDRLADGFKELSGPPPRPLDVRPPLVELNAGTRHTVH
jgi:hypothetical protein